MKKNNTLLYKTCIIGFTIAFMTFMQSCEKLTNEDNSIDNTTTNPFVGTWIVNGSYDTPPDGLSPTFYWMSGYYNYSITITNDYRCHLVGTNNVSVVFNSGNPNTETRLDDYYLAYDMDGNNCIITKGRTPKPEDGLYLDGSLGLLKDDNTLTGDVYIQGPNANGQSIKIRREINFIKQ